ncbi:RluA family pseudouridine synthase [Hyphobacterium sp. HN65]|uniref:Pseudouridine synthase n=1 Tax=Hyphobacterium lacteum TaxID=3116575 RepID=A0ABU7LRM1_9PROT|nr:RluA family pseudouridine synthase [Hyphobacterium sp. HN65]MEE2526239.1 RluA family pseudouridine synthase [Hyphobacterium sp. HN65]
MRGLLPVIHADDHILVLDKPAGLLSVPGKTPDRADCLESRAREEYRAARIIHRLDMDTSGVIVLALTAKAQATIGRQFEKRETQKRYVALVRGTLEADTGRVDAPIITDWPNRPRQHIDPVNGRQAITDWRVLERGGGISRMALTPLTGRSHQLRLHMAHIGHPILGDNFYADTETRALRDRLCLHAESLGFIHPESGEHLRFTSPAPF